MYPNRILSDSHNKCNMLSVDPTAFTLVKKSSPLRKNWSKVSVYCVTLRYIDGCIYQGYRRRKHTNTHMSTLSMRCSFHTYSSDLVIRHWNCDWKCANKTKATIYTASRAAAAAAAKKIAWQHDIGVVKRHRLIRLLCLSYGNSMATEMWTVFSVAVYLFPTCWAICRKKRPIKWLFGDNLTHTFG